MSPTEPVLIDSNVPMYALGKAHPYKLPCQRVLDLILRGELNATTNTEVHQEILHRYFRLGLADIARQASEKFQALVPLVLPVGIEDIVRARELSIRHPTLSSRDLIHVAVMLNNGIRTIVSADRDFDVVSEIKRLDPAQAAPGPGR